MYVSMYYSWPEAATSCMICCILLMHFFITVFSFSNCYPSTGLLCFLFITVQCIVQLLHMRIMQQPKTVLLLLIPAAMEYCFVVDCSRCSRRSKTVLCLWRFICRHRKSTQEWTASRLIVAESLWHYMASLS